MTRPAARQGASRNPTCTICLQGDLVLPSLAALVGGHRQ